MKTLRKFLLVIAILIIPAVAITQSGVFSTPKWQTGAPASTSCAASQTCMYTDNSTGWFQRILGAAAVRLATTAEVNARVGSVTASSPLAATTGTAPDIRYAATTKGAYPVATSTAENGTAMQLSQWRQRFDCDLTTESNQTFDVSVSTDVAITLCGLSMTTKVSASTVTGGVTNFDIQNGTGLRVIPGSGIVNAKDLGVRVALSQLGISVATANVRMWVYVTTSGETPPTIAGNVYIGPRIGALTTFNSGVAIFNRTTDTAASTYTTCGNVWGTSATTSTALNMALASYDVYVIELSGLQARTFKGLYSSGWPADDALLYDATALPATATLNSAWQDQAVTGTANFVRDLNSSAQTPSHIYKRIRIDISGKLRKSLHKPTHWDLPVSQAA